MNAEKVREYCLSKNGVKECLPFDEETLVFKVMGKMFLLTNLEGDPSISIKVEPDRGLEMRGMYSSVQPAYHMNKLHWVMVALDGSISNREIFGWIDASYNLVVGGLTRKQKQELAGL